MDLTPYDVAHRDGERLTVRRYRATPSAPRGKAPPLLLIPPLMVRPFIYDLSPSRSFVAALLAEGHDVFLVDFGAPGPDDEGVTLERYVLDWVPQAVEVTSAASPSGRLTLIGYCMGGLFALLHTSVHDDRRVSNIVTIASPADSVAMGWLAWIGRTFFHPLLWVSQRLGNVPGWLSSAVFKSIHPMHNLTRHLERLKHRHDPEFIEVFDAMTHWTRTFVDYPGEAFRRFFRDFIRDNALSVGSMTFVGEGTSRVADLSRIRCPLLSFAGKSDVLAPEAAVRRGLELVGSEDKQLVLVPGGHLGAVAGRMAPEAVWQRTIDWLAARA